MTDPTNDELINVMPFKVLEPIGTDSDPPTWQQVNDAVTKLAANARAVPSDEGDGLLGHSAIIIGNIRYMEISHNNVDFIPPPTPNVGPVHRANPSYAQIEEAKRVHALSKYKFKTYHMVQEILKLMLLTAIHKHYKQKFWTDDFQYVCTLKQLLDSLKQYRVKTSKELNINTAEMQKPWDSSKETIHSFLGRVRDGLRFDPSIPEETCVRQTVDIICANPGFGTAYSKWNDKPIADRMSWDKMEQHFIFEDKSRVALLALTPTPVTYPGAANSVTNPGTTTTPPSANDMICTSLAEMTKVMNKLINASPTTANSSTTTNNNNTRPPRRRNPPAGGREPTATEASNMTYCFSHGWCVKGRNGQEDHTSGSCKYPNVGHKINATATNKLGGECRICNSWKPNWFGILNGE